MKKISSMSLALIVIVLAIWAIVFSITQPRIYEFRANELAAIRGCYSIDGQPILVIQDKKIITNDMEIGFHAIHEKNRDSLITDVPIIVTAKPPRKIVVSGSLTKIPIARRKVINLQLWDVNNLEIRARRAPCTTSVS